MKCPECNTEINDSKRRFCPNCGAPVNDNDNDKHKDDEPKLSRGLMIFIAAAILFLIAYGTISYMNHKDDPEYFRTAIEPDSNLADKNTVKFDTLVPDTTKRDSIQRAEKREAERILNSIRKKPAEESSEKKEESGTENSGNSQESTTSTTTETTAPATEPAPISAPKPKVEQIESE